MRRGVLHRPPLGPPRWLRTAVTLVTAVAVMSASFTATTSLLTTDQAEAAPASTPRPAAAAPLLSEDFQRDAGSARLISSYASAAGRYRADPAALAQCRGWVAAGTQSTSSSAPVRACGSQPSWNQAQQLSRAVAAAAGSGASTAKSNRALSLVSSPTAPLRSGTTVLESPVTTKVPGNGRFLVTRLDLAQTSCTPGPRRLQMGLKARGGNVVDVGSPVDACRGSSVAMRRLGTARAASAQAARLTADRAVLWTKSTVGVRIRTAGTTPAGAALDEVTVLDATPQVGMAFGDGEVEAGGTSTLTATITNTDDLLSKPGFSLRTTLPEGLAVADEPGYSTTCRSTSTRGATAGSTSWTAKATLGGGQASCVIKVQVVAQRAGQYDLAPTSFTAQGLDTTTARATLAAAEVAPEPTPSAITTPDVPSPTALSDSSSPSPQPSASSASASPSTSASPTPSPSASPTRAGTTRAGVQAAAAADISCVAGSVFTLSATGQIWNVNTSTAARTLAGTFTTTTAPTTGYNGLAVPAGGAFAYAIDQNFTSGSQVRVFRYDAAAGTTTLYNGGAASVTGASGVGGAINPVNGYYYFTYSNANGSFDLYAFNTATNTGVGRVGTISGLNTAASNGDITFDSQGRLYVLGSGTTAGQSQLALVNQAIPTTAGTAALTVTIVASIATGTSYNGATFDSDGFFYITNNATAPGVLTRVDPNSGAIGATTTMTGGTTTQNTVDAADCNYNPVLSLRKNITARVAGTDQFTLSITGNGVSTGNTATTTGTATGVQAAVAGPIPAIPARTYTVAETAASGSLANYSVSLSCVDTANGNAVVTTTGSGASQTVTIPANTTTPRNVVCTYTNGPLSPQLSLTKTASPTTITAAGTAISYAFLVTNTGNIAITGLSVTEPTFSGTGTAPAVSCPTTTLAIGASTTCTASYTATQADVDAGSITNTGQATGTSTAGAAPAVRSTATVTASPTSSLSLTKTAGTPADVNTNGRTDAGDTIPYSFLVTNTGTATLTTVAVNDGRLSAVTCPATTLAPGAATTCTGTYTITQADANGGTVTNTATASARNPGGSTVTSASSSTSTSLTQISTLSLTKTAGTPTDTNTNSRVDAGDRIAYSFQVTNTGTTTISSIAITDAKVGATSCAATTLAPGASTTCTTTTAYTIIQADVDAGSVANTATATGANPSGTAVTSNSSSTATPTSTTGTLALTKTAGTPVDVNRNGRVDAGDTIAYSFAVTNTGAQTLTAVAITDPKVGATTCPTTTLAPGASTTCTATYTITQADVDAGAVANTASARGTNPAGAAVTSNTSSTSTTTSTVATLTLTKTAGTPTDVNANGRVDAGDRIAYSFAVTNTGAQTLTSVAITDPKVGATTCPATTLAPGAIHHLHRDLHDHPGRRELRRRLQHRHRHQPQPRRRHRHLHQLHHRHARPRTSPPSASPRPRAPPSTSTPTAASTPATPSPTASPSPTPARSP